jgi:peroxiredoxin
MYTVSGRIEGLVNAKIYLSYTDTDTKKTDSIITTDGSFHFSGNIHEPLFYVLQTNAPKTAALVFFLEPGKITINGHKDSLNKAIVTGSRSDLAYKEWAKDWNHITALAGPMYRRLDSANQRGKVKESPEERKIFDDGMRSLEIQTNKAVVSFIKKYPNSPVAPFIIYDRYISYPNHAMAKSTFASLGQPAKNSLYGKRIAEYQRVYAKTGIGASPEFTARDTSGKIVALSSFRGKYVLVDFWASWCAPCRKENPNVVEAYKKFHNKGFEIVSISLDTKKDDWLHAIQMDGLTWKHVSDLKGWESGLVKEYGVTVVPTSFLIDKEGKVIANNLRGEALQKIMQQLFN